MPRDGIPMYTINRPAVRYSIDDNERLLAEIDRARDAFRETAERLAAWAKANTAAPDADVRQFLGTIDDALADLFHRVTSEIEDDVERDKRLIGAEG